MDRIPPSVKIPPTRDRRVSVQLAYDKSGSKLAVKKPHGNSRIKAWSKSINIVWQGSKKDIPFATIKALKAVVGSIFILKNGHHQVFKVVEQVLKLEKQEHRNQVSCNN